MKTADVVVGNTYHAKVSGKLQTVRIEDAFLRYVSTRGELRSMPHWRATNLATGRTIVIKSAQRLRAIPQPTEAFLEATNG